MATIKVKTDMPGMISKVLVEVGSQVAAEDTLAMLESMKMEMPFLAPQAGRVTEILIVEGEMVSEGDVLVTIET